MASIARFRLVWSGTPITGGGATSFYSANLAPGAFSTALRNFFAGQNGLFPVGLTITFPSSGDLIDESTGALTGTWSAAAPVNVSGSGTGAYAAGVGMRVTWNTAGVTRRRRVRGTTFLVPMKASEYDTDGTISSAAKTSVETGAAALVAADSGSLRIWTRPSAPGLSDGHAHPVLSATVPDMVAWLRSRRT